MNRVDVVDLVVDLVDVNLDIDLVDVDLDVDLVDVDLDVDLVDVDLVDILFERFFGVIIRRPPPIISRPPPGDPGGINADPQGPIIEAFRVQRDPSDRSQSAFAPPRKQGGLEGRQAGQL